MKKREYKKRKRKKSGQNPKLTSFFNSDPLLFRLFLKGEDDDNVVICTKTETFAIKLVENSNVQLLCDVVPEGGGGLIIRGEANGCHEMRRTAPRMHRLLEILSENPLYESNVQNALRADASRAVKRIRKQDYNADSPPKPKKSSDSRFGVTFNELLSRVQASEGELRRGLENIHAVEILSHWWILRTDYIAQVLEGILSAITLLDSKEENILLTDICENVSNDLFPHEIVKHVAKIHGSLTKDGSAIRLDGAKVAARIAVQLLESHSSSCAAVTLPLIASNVPSWYIAPPPVTVFSLEPCKQLPSSSSASSTFTGVPVSKFLKEWQAVLDRVWPSRCTTNPIPTVSLDMIQSFILIEAESSSSKTQSVLLFPQERLHHEATKRFKQLFSVRPRWTMKEITPFIEPICSVDVKMNELLLANARMTVQSGDKTSVFSSR